MNNGYQKIVRIDIDKIVTILQYVKSSFVNKTTTYNTNSSQLVQNNKRLGNILTDTIIEKTSTSPRFYWIIGTLDTVSGKTQRHVIVIQDGKTILNTPYKFYFEMRTGAMDALLLNTLAVKLKSGRSIAFGTGNVSLWSIYFLKALNRELKIIDIVTNNGFDNDFYHACRQIGVRVNFVDQSKVYLRNYNLIMCHSSHTKPLVNQGAIAPGTVITSYTSIHEFEIDLSFLSNPKVTLIYDCKKNISKLTNKNPLTILPKQVLLHELINNQSQVNINGITIFSAPGTPIQDFGLCKYLIEKGLLDI